MGLNKKEIITKILRHNYQNFLKGKNKTGG